MCSPATLVYVDEFGGYLDSYRPDLKVGDIYPPEGERIVRIKHVCLAMDVAEIRLSNRNYKFTRPL